MKTVVAAILWLTAGGVWAQGRVDFRNTQQFASEADRKVYQGFVGNGTGLTGTNYVAGLWYVLGADNGGQLAGTGGRPALNFDPNAPSVFAFRDPTTTLPGTWDRGPNVPFYLVVENLVVGAVATLQVRVWDIAKYASFDAAFAGGEYGVSAPFNWQRPSVGDPPSRQYMEGLRAFAVIPEPSTIAILGVSLLVLRRLRRLLCVVDDDQMTEVPR